MKKLLTEKQIQNALDGLYKAVVSEMPADAPVAVVGIRTRGQTLAERVIQRLGEDYPDLKLHRGVLDITFYRDDLSQRRGAPVVRATEIDFDLEGVWLLLVDDVLNTGRSVRAALDALHDFGRPSVIRLAVLVDRGGRELPIAADFVGKTVKVPAAQRVQVRLKENDGEEGVWIIDSE